MDESLGEPLSERTNQRVCKIFNFICWLKQDGCLQVELTSIIELRRIFHKHLRKKSINKFWRHGSFLLIINFVIILIDKYIRAHHSVQPTNRVYIDRILKLISMKTIYKIIYLNLTNLFPSA